MNTKRWTRWLAVGLVALAALILLAACGGDDTDSPELAAVPTRTPVPATPPPAEGESVPAGEFEVRSLHESVGAFLLAAEDASPIDRVDLITQELLTPNTACYTSTWWPASQPLEMLGFNPVSTDLETWQAALDIYPAEQLVARIRRALDESARLLPVDYPVTVCALPMHAFMPPEEMPRGGVGSNVLGRDVIMLECRAGEYCLDWVAPEIAWAYAYAYQVGQAEVMADDASLLTHAIYQGRATAFTRRVYPDAFFPWDFTLSLPQEAELWPRMQESLDDALGGSRFVWRLLWGDDTNQDRYPPLGGIHIGSQIAQAYLDGHPNLPLGEFMALDPETILDESGYDPVAAYAALEGQIQAGPPGVELVSLRDAVGRFVTASYDIDPGGREVILMAEAGDALSLCPSETSLDTMLGLPDIAEIDLPALGVAVDAFPEDDLLALTAETLGAASEVAPQVLPIRACLIPVPPPTDPANAWRAGIPQAVAASGDLLFVACSAGENCLDGLPFEVARGYAFAYQHAESGDMPDEITLLDALVFAARAGDFARRLYPDAVAPWEGALSPEQTATAWAALEPLLASEDPDPAWVSRLYGRWTGQEETFPQWALVTLADAIMAEYRAENPDTPWTEIAALDPAVFLATSGYGAE